MPKPHPLVTDIRNAYDSHSRDDFERAIGRLEQVLDRLPPQDCQRGNACVCTSGEARRLCGFRAPLTVATQLAPCSRGPACSCVTFESRLQCANVVARPAGGKL